jgi:hypothetical protein
MDMVTNHGGSTIRQGFRGRELPMYYPDAGIGVQMIVFRPESEFHSPRHSHPHSQVRYIVSGTINYGRDTYSAGDIIIVPDSVKYGPMRPGPGAPPVFLQTAFTGPSGVPILHPDIIQEAYAEMSHSGTFEKGIYRPNDGRPRDAYLAAQEHVAGGPIETSPAQLNDIIVVHSGLLPWVDHTDGISVKHVAYILGTGPNVKVVRLEAGATLPAGVSRSHQARYLIEGAVDWQEKHYDAISVMFYPSGREYPATRALTQSTLVVKQWANAGDPVVPFADL